MLNIETKVRLDSLDTTKNLVSQFASFVGKLKQKDTYFLLGKKRLKAREEGGRTGFIYYQREGNSGPMQSRYFRFGQNKFFFWLLKILFRITLGTKKVVEKERLLYVHKNTRIHLDKVKQLGSFLELETVVKNEKMYQALKQEHEEVKNRLHLEDMKELPCSYSDLIAV